MRNVPAGVAPSPSRLWLDTPLLPTRARHAPATGVQHAPTRRQRRRDATVERAVAVSTVRSWFEAPVEVSPLARLAVQPATTRGEAPAAGTKSASAVTEAATQ